MFFSRPALLAGAAVFLFTTTAAAAPVPIDRTSVDVAHHAGSVLDAVAARADDARTILYKRTGRQVQAGRITKPPAKPKTGAPAPKPKPAAIGHIHVVKACSKTIGPAMNAKAAWESVRQKVADHDPALVQEMIAKHDKDIKWLQTTHDQHQRVLDAKKAKDGTAALAIDKASTPSAAREGVHEIEEATQTSYAAAEKILNDKGHTV